MENRIMVELQDGRQIVYTKEVLQLLLDDPYVAEIMDMETDEILKMFENDGTVYISANI